MRQVVLLGALLFTISANAAIPASERDALIALYQSTNGASWTNHDGWLGAPGTECSWYGVDCEAGDNVRHVLLYENHLDGTLPASIANLTKLRTLQVYRNSIHGTLPPELGQMSELEGIFATDNLLTGTIPAQLGALKKLEILALAGNQLAGAIPAELSGAAALKELILAYNQLSGPIPPSLAGLTNLVELELSVNQLTGTIPAELGALQHLERLGLTDNRLTDVIPQELGNASALVSLRVGYNQLAGTLPSRLGNLHALEQFDATNNRLAGTIPDSFAGLTSLKHLDVTTNQLSGPLPNVLWSLTTLEELYLGDNDFSDALPAEVGQLANLQVLSLYYNHLDGTLPLALTTIAPLRSLELQGNDFTGPLPAEVSQLANLTWLDVADNDLTGPIPAELRNLTKLEVLSLYDNAFAGPIPPELGQLTNLTILYLARNRLTGTIPDSLRNLTKLQQFTANDNQLGGPLPPWIGEWTELEDLFLGQNQFAGPLPAGLATLEHLAYLDLSENRLTGSLPDFTRFTNLRYFTAQYNEFSGPLPATIGAATNLVDAVFSYNRLSGPLPREIGNLSKLEWLDIANNDFEGAIPPELGNDAALFVLTMWGNRFSGTVPKELGNLTSLGYLDLSFNALHGPWPAEITQLTSLVPSGSDFAFNSLYANDPQVHAFVNSKQYDGAYEATQTVVPKDIRIVSTTDRSATLAWTPIAFSYFPGGYQVTARSASGATTVATTSGKDADAITVRNLAASTPYTFTVATVTYPHEQQKNLNASDASAPLQATTGPPVLAPAEVVLTDAANGMVQIDGVEVGEDSFTLTNFGDVATNLTLERGDDFFTISPQQFTLAPGASQIVKLQSIPQTAGTYYGYVAVQGDGTGDGVIAYVVLLSTVRPPGTVIAQPVTTQIEVAGVPGSDTAGTAQFRNSGTATLTGIVLSDQEWVEVPPETITIEPGATGTVNFRIVRAKRPDVEGALVANLSLIYVSGANAASPVEVLDGTTPINVSKVTIVDITKPPVTSGTIPPISAGELPFFIPGVSGTSSLRSDLTIVNPAGRSLNDLRLYFTRQGATNIATLQPLGFAQSIRLANVVGNVYAAEGSGTLQIRGNGNFGAASKATAVTASGTLTGALPVFRADRSIRATESLYLAGVTENGELFVQETGGQAGSVRIEFLSAAGAVLSARTETIGGFALLDLPDAIPANTATIAITNVPGSSAMVTAYVRERDANGDPFSVVDWSRYYRYAKNEAVRVPFADGRTAATGGGKHRSVRSHAARHATNIVLFNPTSGEMRATLQTVETNGRTSERTITLAPRATLTISDAAQSSGTSTAHVVITPLRGELVATARSDAGSAIPVVAANAGLRLGQTQLFSALDDSAATRTSYGFVESTGQSVTVRAELILEEADAKVAAVTARTFTLAPREQLLVPELVRSFAGAARDTLFGDLHGLVLQLEVIAGGGAVVPMVVETDVATGDVSVRIE